MNVVHMVMRKRRAWSITLQLSLVVFTNFLAFALRFDGYPPQWAVAACLQMLGICTHAALFSGCAVANEFRRVTPFG